MPTKDSGPMVPTTVGHEGVEAEDSGTTGDLSKGKVGVTEGVAVEAVELEAAAAVVRAEDMEVAADGDGEVVKEAVKEAVADMAAEVMEAVAEEVAVEAMPAGKYQFTNHVRPLLLSSLIDPVKSCRWGWSRRRFSIPQVEVIVPLWKLRGWRGW